MKFYTEDYSFTEEAHGFIDAFMPFLTEEVNDRFNKGVLPEKILYDLCGEVLSVLHGETDAHGGKISAPMAEIRRVVSEYAGKGYSNEFLFYAFNTEANTEILEITIKKGLEFRKKRREQRKAGC